MPDAHEAAVEAMAGAQCPERPACRTCVHHARKALAALVRSEAVRAALVGALNAANEADGWVDGWVDAILDALVPPEST